QKQECALTGNIPFHCHSLKAAPPRRKIVTARDRLHRHEPDVMAVGRMLGAGIAEADEKQHGFNGREAALSQCALRRQGGLCAASLLLWLRRRGGGGCSTRSRSSAGCSAWSRTGSSALR